MSKLPVKINDELIIKTEQITDGMSGQVYKAHTDKGMFYIIKSYEDSKRNNELEDEFFALDNLYKLGLHVPKPLGLEIYLDKMFLIMEFVEGVSLFDIFTNPEFEAKGEIEAKNKIYIKEFAKVIFDYHNIDMTAFKEYKNRNKELGSEVTWQITSNWYNDFLDILRKETEGELEDKYSSRINYLRSKAINNQRITLLHGDYHPGNILVKDKTPYLIDIVFDIGDYRLDLAWTRFIMEHSKLTGTYDLFIEEYSKLLGGPIEHLDIFYILVLLKWLIFVFEPTMANPKTDPQAKEFLRQVINGMLARVDNVIWNAGKR